MGSMIIEMKCNKKLWQGSRRVDDGAGVFSSQSVDYFFLQEQIVRSFLQATQ